MWVALCLTLTDTTSVIQQANAIEASRRVAPGCLGDARGRRNARPSLNGIRDFER